MANPPIEQEVLIRFKADTGRLTRGARAAETALTKTATASSKAAKEIGSAAVAGEQIGRIGSALPGQLGTAAGAVGALTGAFKNARTSMLAFGLGIAGIIGGIVKFGPVAKDWIVDLFDTSSAIDALVKSLGELIEKQDAAAASARAANAALFPDEAKFAARGRTIESLGDIRSKELSAIGVQFAKEQAEIIEQFRRNILDSTNVKSIPAQLQLFVDDLAESRRTLVDSAAAAQDQFEAASNTLANNIVAEEAGTAAKKEDTKTTKEHSAAVRKSTVSLARLAELFAGLGPITGGALTAANPRLGPVGSVAARAGSLDEGDPGLAPGSRFRRRGGNLLQRLGGPFAQQAQEANAMQAAAGAAEVLRDMEFQRVANDIRGVATEAERLADTMTMVGDSFVSAFEAWGEGSKSFSEAMREFVTGAIADVLIGESKKHAALAVADLLTGNPAGAGGHAAAAAALAAASGAVRSIGTGGGAGASAGGGRLPGAAAGSFGGSAGLGGRSETVIIGTIDDNPRRQRRQLRDMLDRADAESGPGSRIIRA